MNICYCVCFDRRYKAHRTRWSVYLWDEATSALKIIQPEFDVDGNVLKIPPSMVKRTSKKETIFCFELGGDNQLVTLKKILSAYLTGSVMLINLTPTGVYTS